MNIQQLVNSTLASQLETLGAEDVTLDSQALKAVLGETEEDRNINGGSRAELSLDAQFPTDKTIRLRVGMIATTRGKEWKLESFQRGQSMTTLRLIEKNRIED